MAERRIRHAFARYQAPDEEGTPVNRLAFRDQVVDIPEGRQLDRLDALGATVAPDTQLVRAGDMVALAEGASDEELVRWVADAMPAEIEEMAQKRPELGGRLSGARQRIAEQAKIRDDLLGKAVETASAYKPADGEVQAGMDLPDPITTGEATQGRAASGAMNTEIIEDGDTSDVVIGGAPSSRATVDDFDSLVQGPASDVTTYISAHPEQAQQVMEADAAAHGGTARQEVVRVAETATKFG